LSTLLSFGKNIIISLAKRGVKFKKALDKVNEKSSLWIEEE